MRCMEKDLGFPVDKKLDVCACSPEGQLYPGPHQRGVAVGRGRWLSPPREIPPVALHPSLGPLAQEGHGAVEVGPEEGHKDDWRAGAPLQWWKIEGFGLLQHGKGSGGISLRPCKYLKEANKQEKDWAFTQFDSARTRGNGFKLKERIFELDVREAILHSEDGEALAQLPIEAVVPHPWRHSRPGWMGPWAAELVGGSPAHSRGIWTGWFLRCLPNQAFYDFLILWSTLNSMFCLLSILCPEPQTRSHSKLPRFRGICQQTDLKQNGSCNIWRINGPNLLNQISAHPVGLFKKDNVAVRKHLTFISLTTAFQAATSVHECTIWTSDTTIKFDLWTVWVVL